MANVKRGDLVAAGVTKSTKKASMVDPKGAWTKVQERTLGKMQNGGRKSNVYGRKRAEMQLEKRKQELRGGSKEYILTPGTVPRPNNAPNYKKLEYEKALNAAKKPKAKDGKWIQKAIKKPGALRKQLGAKPGQPIPASKLNAAAKKPGKLGQRARLAITLKKMKKK